MWSYPKGGAQDEHNRTTALAPLACLPKLQRRRGERVASALRPRAGFGRRGVASRVRGPSGYFRNRLAEINP
jgi:hypothetical protein